MTFADLYTSATMFSNDVAFGATFSAPDLTAVPESATAFAGIGLAFVAGLVALRLHRRRRAAVAS
jgi:MYXO-CTERM domain-containing protein